MSITAFIVGISVVGAALLALLIYAVYLTFKDENKDKGGKHDQSKKHGSN